ncbi:MAG: hypothetical protein K8S27_03405 [Candidatus Omnitrophica bacterium]|nr:hypothetical protein [Candidatus Omnitrophota bacterium]
MYTLTASGPDGSASAQLLIKVTNAIQPPEEGDFGKKYENMIPDDASVDEYNAKRFALITGIVQDKHDNPLDDVMVTIEDFPEYGTVKTNLDGRFTIPVEGGLELRVKYEKDYFITAHRKILVPINDIAIMETIIMIEMDTKSTTFEFDNNPSTVFVHESSNISDASGTRNMTMVFKGDNKAFAVNKDGTQLFELDKMTVRASEFETPQSMPDILPSDTAFTYCSELSVDGVERVKFDDPVIIWVDNFLGFNVGQVVPVGYYDRDEGEWIGSANGQVVKLLDSNGDTFVDAYDTTGDSVPEVYNVVGLEDNNKYHPGDIYWRAEVDHFTPWDLNWSIVPPEGAIDPNNGEASGDGQDKCEPNSTANSYVNCRSRVYHNDVAIPGTNITLHYASNLVDGYRTNVISVPASGTFIQGQTLPDEILVDVEVAGNVYSQTLPGAADQIANVVWDGTDAFGNDVASATANIEVSFIYNGVYTSAGTNPTLPPQFNQPGTVVTGVPGRTELQLTRSQQIKVTNKALSNNEIADGWTLSNYHYIDPLEPNTLHKGDGRIVDQYTGRISTVGGDGTETTLAFPSGLDKDSDGNLIIAEHGNGRIRKVDPDGNISDVRTGISSPTDVVVDSAGNIYISTGSIDNRVRKIDAVTGDLLFVAGTGVAGYNGEGNATGAQLSSPADLAIDPSGNILIADYGNNLIHKVDITTNQISTIAGITPPGLVGGYSGDGGPATAAELNGPVGVAVDSAGNIFIADANNHVIRKIDTSGNITTVVGNNIYGYNGDNLLATAAQLHWPSDVDIDSNGNIYISDAGNHRIRKVDTNGIITTVAGTGNNDFSGDGGEAINAEIWGPSAVLLDNTNNIFIADSSNHRIRKVTSSAPLPGGGDIQFVEEGVGHVFSSTGRHLRTVDLNTGIDLLTFNHPSGKLDYIEDHLNNRISLQRFTDRIEITSPDTVKTTLHIDSIDKQLDIVEYPDGAEYEFYYSSGGLLTSKDDPENNHFQNVYDHNGRIIDVYDQEGGHKQYSYQVLSDGKKEAKVETWTDATDSYIRTYLDETLSTGEGYSETLHSSMPNKSITSTSAADESWSEIVYPGESLAHDDDMTVKYKYAIDPAYGIKYANEIETTVKESGITVLTNKVVNDRKYEDTNNDGIYDIITRTTTVNNDLPSTVVIDKTTPKITQTITSPEGRVVTTLFDPAKLWKDQTQITGLPYPTVYTHRTDGKLDIVSTNTRSLEYTYDSNDGFLIKSEDQDANITEYLNTDIGQVEKITRPDLTEIIYDYDLSGNLIKITNPSLIDHAFAHNSVNLKNEYVPPVVPKYSYVYDRARRLVQINFPSAKQIKNIYYDSLLDKIETPEGIIDFYYYGNNKTKEILMGSEGIAYTYLGDFIKTEVLDPAGTLPETITYDYNNDFALSGLTYAGGTSSFDYDDDGILTLAGLFTITPRATDGLPEQVTDSVMILDRDFNDYQEVDYQKITVNSQNVAEWSLTYYNTRLIETKTETINGRTPSTYYYKYDSMGRLEEVRDTDATGTLLESYTYINGKRQTDMAGRTYLYDNEDRLLSATGTTLTYTLDGYAETKIDTDYEYTYAYSSRGELHSVIKLDKTVTPNTTTTIEYVHDPLGRRIAKKVNGLITEKYLWRGQTQLLAVFDDQNNLVMRFEYGENRMPYSMVKSGATYYLTYDQIGSLRVVTDTSGQIVKQIDYDSFGNIINTPAIFNVPFGFAGGLYDFDTALIRFGARDYDPDIGRWTAKDPILFEGGDVDLMVYCGSDPVNFIDLSGNMAIADDILYVTAGAVAISYIIDYYYDNYVSVKRTHLSLSTKIL